MRVPITIVGRTREIAALSAFLHAPRSHGTSLLVEGEAGIGKSVLLDHAAALVASAGWTVLRCRGLEHERELPYAGLDELLGSQDLGAHRDLPAPQRTALEVALLRRSPEVAVRERDVGLGIATVISLVSESAPVLLIIDDAHWLDSATTRAVAFAVRRLAERPVTVILGQRPGDGGSNALQRALESGQVERLTLDLMDRDDVDELLQVRLGLRLALPRLTALHEATRGNPLLALEMARLLGNGDDDALRRGQLPVPDALRQTLRHRVTTFSEPARRALEVVAVARRPTRSLVTAVIGPPGDDAVDELVVSDAVTEARGQLDVFHPLLRSATIATIGPARLRRLHRSLAKVARSDDERVVHLAGAATKPDRKVADAVAAAAARAEQRGATMTAFELAGDALDLTPPGDGLHRAERAIVAARLAFHAGDPGWAAERLRGILEDPDIPRRGELLHQLSRVELQTDGLRAAAARLREAEIAAQSDYLRGRIAIDMANYGRAIDGNSAALLHARRALDFARRARHDGLLGEVHATLAALEFRAGSGIRRRRLALAAAYERRAGRVGIRVSDEALAYQLLWAGYLGEARSLIQSIAATAEPDIPVDRVTPTWQLALVEFRAGRWDESARLLDLSLRASDVAGRNAVSPAARWLRSVLAAHRGALGSARAIIEDLIADTVASGDGSITRMARGVLGFVELCAGDHAAAVAQLEPLAEGNLAADPGAAFELPDLVEALVSIGRLSDAEEITRSFEARSTRLDRPWGLANAARCRALVDGASGSLDSAAEALGPWTAEACIEEPFSIARNRLVLGVVERRRKRKQSSREALLAARDGFQRLGAVLWADRAADELGRTRGASAGIVGLTSTERRIAELAAEGRTNREIADRLFLTPKTVEWNLTRVYHKLGVRSRTQLARSDATSWPPTLPG
jgi:DNA-binding CsgD family transcriptional regulator